MEAVVTTSPASASALEPMTVTHTRDLVASILHAHASILHAPAPPLTSAELHEARSIVSQLLDGAGPPKPGPLPPALRTPRPLPASPSSVSSSPVPGTVMPATPPVPLLGTPAGLPQFSPSSVSSSPVPRTVQPSRHSTGEISTPGEFDTAGEISTPEGDESPATRLPLRQLARLDLNAAADGAPPLSAEETRALEWAQQREAAAHEPSGVRGGLLVASARVDALGVIAALVRDDACGGGRTLVVATAASLEAWEERLRAARLPLHLHQPKAARRTAQPVAPPARCVVLTTYGMLLRKEYDAHASADAGWRSKRPAAGAGAAAKKSYLHLFSWRRLVLADAKEVSNPSTQRAQAAAALDAERRWALLADASAASRKPAAVALLRAVGVDSAAAGASWKSLRRALAHNAAALWAES
jgi:hypothetical protein